MIARFGVDELNVDAHARFPPRLNAALKDMADVQLAADCPTSSRLPL